MKWPAQCMVSSFVSLTVRRSSARPSNRKDCRLAHGRPSKIALPAMTRSRVLDRYGFSGTPSP